MEKAGYNGDDYPKHRNLCPVFSYQLPGVCISTHRQSPRPDIKKDYQFLTIGISTQNEKIKLPTSFIKTTEEKFNRVKDRLISDPALFVRESIMKNKSVSMKGTDGNTLVPNELYERIAKEFKLFKETHNNPIEINEVWIK